MCSSFRNYYLRKLWTRIREDTLKSKAPVLITELDTPIIKVARDFNQRTINEIVFSDQKTMRLYKKLEKDFSVKSKKKITYYNDKLPLFESYGIKNPINILTEENIYLKSGGYLVINPTEALTSIDINSGRSTSEKNIEITALNTNLEACEEIYKQIQLRNIAGLIVIDFIDMNINSNNLKVERKIKELFYKDRSRVQFTKISQFGLMEISRQRIGQSIYETFYNKCDCCGGSGFKKTSSIIIYNMISDIKGINAIGNKDDIEIQIDEKFYNDNSKEINKKIKSIISSFKIKFVKKSIPKNIYELDNDLINKLKINTKEIIEKNKIEDSNNEKSYRRKIKKKLSDN